MTYFPNAVLYGYHIQSQGATAHLQCHMAGVRMLKPPDRIQIFPFAIAQTALINPLMAVEGLDRMLKQSQQQLLFSRQDSGSGI